MKYVESNLKNKLEQYIEAENYTQYFKQMKEAIHTLKETERWTTVNEIILQAIATYLAINNKVAAMQLLTEYSLFIANYGSIEQKVNYYYLLAVAYEDDVPDEKTLTYLKKAQKLAEQSNITTMLPQIYYHLSKYYEKKDLQKSVAYGHKSIALKHTIAGQLHYVKLLIEQYHLSTVEVKLAEAKKYFDTTPTNKDKVTYWRLVAQYTCMRDKPLDAYQYLKERLSDVADNSKWGALLYEDICNLSKRHHDVETYDADLKAALANKKRVLQVENSEQLQLLEHYFDDTNMKRIAWTDTLTNIPNRRYLEETYMDMNAPFVAFILDIDHFKSINDRAGHLVGDEVIQEIVRALHSVVTSYKGQLIRFGGDEFFGIVPLEMAQISSFGTALIEAAQTVQVATPTQVISPTISVGLCYVAKQKPLEAVIQYVDEALYTAKRNGRNQFVLQNEVLQ